VVRRQLRHAFYVLGSSVLEPLNVAA
jgi:hypothetical protein